MDISGSVLESDKLATAGQRDRIFEFARPTPIANDATPFLSNSVLKPFGGRGATFSSLGLHRGPQACSPSQGLSGCASQTQPVSSQREHFIYSPLLPRITLQPILAMPHGPKGGMVRLGASWGLRRASGRPVEIRTDAGAPLAALRQQYMDADKRAANGATAENDQPRAVGLDARERAERISLLTPQQ